MLRHNNQPIDTEALRQLLLFGETDHLDPDCWISGTPDVLDTPEFVEYVYPVYPVAKKLGEIVLCDPVEKGWRYE